MPGSKKVYNAIKQVLEKFQESKEIVRDAAETILETARGDKYSWPFRFSAVLVKVDGKWLFHQIHFAYPRKGYPSERNVTWK